MAESQGRGKTGWESLLALPLLCYTPQERKRGCCPNLCSVPLQARRNTQIHPASGHCKEFVMHHLLRIAWWLGTNLCSGQKCAVRFRHEVCSRSTTTSHRQSRTGAWRWVTFSTRFGTKHRMVLKSKCGNNTYPIFIG